MRRRASKQHSLPRDTDEDPNQEPILRFEKFLFIWDLHIFFSFSRSQVKRRLSLQHAVKSFKNKIGTSRSNSAQR